MRFCNQRDFLRAVYPDPFLEIADELHEIGQQGFLFGGHAEQPVLHFLGADTITHGGQLRIYAERSCPYLIQAVVDFLSRHALARSPACRPHLLRHPQLHAESRLRVFPDVQPCHHGTIPVGIGLALFKVERHLYIRLIHNLFLSCKITG